MTIGEQNGENRYQRLAERLASAIHAGTFPPGSRLPSLRRCAEAHQVSINTVLSSYQRLEDRGLIEVRPQSGYYVRTLLPTLHTPATPPQTIKAPSDTVLDLIDTVFATQTNPAFTNVSLACPQSIDFYPSGRLSNIMTSLLRQKPQLIGTYPLPPGDPTLRREIARRSLILGMTLQADDITVTHGCMEAIQLALRVVTRPGDCVGLETPTYFYLLPLLASLGLKALEIPTDPQNGLSLDALELMLSEKRLNAIIAMPTVQNPLGFSMPVAAKKRLADLVNTYQVPLIEDGLYAEIQFGKTLSPAVKSFDRGGWVIFCSSFSKTLAPDFRLGWVIGGRFTSALHKLKAVSSMSESGLLSETVAQFLESGGYDHHIRRLRRRYAAQVDAARALIAEYFPNGTRATVPAGGFVFWVEFPEQVDTIALFHRMLAENICVTPGTLYSPNSQRYRNALRLSCCYPFNTRYTHALQRIGEVACEMSEIAPGLNAGQTP